MKRRTIFILLTLMSFVFAEDITINFNSDPGTVSCSSSPLRYGKKHALTFDQDDNLRDVYTALLPLFTGGTPMLIDDLDTTFDVASSGVFFSDGFGNDIPFKANTASWVYSSNDVEYWQWATGWPRGGRLGYPDLHEMLDNGFGISSHGYYGDINARGEDTIALGATLYRNWLERETGEIPLSFVQPGGTVFNTDLWTEKWFDKGALYGVLGSGGVYCPERVDNVDHSQLTEPIIQGRYSLEGKTSAEMITMVDALMAESNNYWQRCFGHNIEKTPTGFIDYDEFKTFVTYVAANYADDIWVPSNEEIIRYFHVRDNVAYDVAAGGSAQQKVLSINTDNVPANVKHRQLSFTVSSSQDISSVDFGGLTGNYRQTGVNEYLFDVDLSTEGAAVTISDISGNTSVYEYAAGEVYSITPQAGASYEWIVSGDAEIVSGANTSSVTVNLGSEDVTLTARIENEDGNADYTDLTIETITILHVKPVASGDGSGGSWANAMSDLQAAINTAGVSQVWVAAGTYSVPDGNGFVPVENVDVYGGFAGTEADIGDRAKSDLDNSGEIDPWEFINVTLLTADNDGNADNYTSWPDNIGTTMDGNARHVVYQDGNFITETIWDGLTIAGGYADNLAADSLGGGVYARRELNINNSIIKNCYAAGHGGGMYLYQTESSGCYVNECSTDEDGGGIYNNNGSVSKATITGSYAGSDAGGLENYGSSSEATHCTITGNTSAESAGGLYNYQGVVSYTIISHNSSESYGGGVYNNDGTLDHVTVCSNSTSAYSTGGGILSYKGTISNSNICGNSVVAAGGGIHMKYGGTVTACRIYNNRTTASYSDGGGISLEGGSTLENSVVFNNYAPDNGGGIYNKASSVTNCTVVNNGAGDTGGGIYNNTSPTVLNSVFWGNSAQNGDAQYSQTATVSYSAFETSVPAGTGNIVLNSVNDADNTSPYFTTPTTFSGLATDAADTLELQTAEWNIENTSVLINAGNDAGAPAEDIDGFTRSSTDMGAYEYHLFSTPGQGSTNITVDMSYEYQLDLSWTSGNGTERAVFMKTGNSGSAVPEDGTSYTASSSFGAGSQIASTGWYCIYNGEDHVVTVTGLSAGTDYRVMVCEYNGTSGNELYLTETQTGNPATVSTLQSDVPSPIELMEFTADYRGGRAVISWSTASEIENSHFIVYRDGENIGRVDGAGTSSGQNDYVLYDETVIPGRHVYELEDVSYAGEIRRYPGVVLVVDNEDLLPEEFSLEAPYPNPFNPSTVITYLLPEKGNVDVVVADLKGRVIFQNLFKDQTAGRHEIVWNPAAAQIGTGIYFIRAAYEGRVQSRKVLYIK